MNLLLFTNVGRWANLVSPTVNLGEKEKVHLQNFVLTGRPTEDVETFPEKLKSPRTQTPSGVHMGVKHGTPICLEARKILYTMCIS